MPLQTSEGTLKLIVYLAILREGRILLVRYVTPPNPDRPGWWIPAPELEFGQSPQQLMKIMLKELCLDGKPRLAGVESFGGREDAWHVMFHYTCEVSGGASATGNIQETLWVDADSMPDAEQFAHGQWERNLALRKLQESSEPVAV